MLKSYDQRKTEVFYNHDANNVIFIQFKKVDDKIHDNVLSTFINYDDEN